MSSASPQPSQSPQRQSPPCSMTLAVSRDDAVRMLEASGSLNAAFNQVHKDRKQNRIQESDSAATKEVNNRKSDDISKPAPLSPSPTVASPVRSTAKIEDEEKRNETGSEPVVKTEQKVQDTSDKVKADESKDESKVPDIILAASRCEHPLVRTFLETMKELKKSNEEMEVCLLIFLDMDKSTKLLTAFSVLHKLGKDQDQSKEKKENIENENKENISESGCDESKIKKENGEAEEKPAEEKEKLPSEENTDNDTNANMLSYTGITALFKSFLTAISTCIHQQSSTDDDTKAKASNDNSSETDSQKSDKKEKEIHEIGVFAADRLMEHVVQKGGAESKKSTSAVISFEAFGEWYNLGGFELVPWLELLDLAKWDYAGRAAAMKQNTNDKPGNSSSYQSGAPGNASRPRNGPENMSSGNGRSPVPLPSRSTSPATRCVVSFDFTGAMPNDKPLHINITEENLSMLKSVVLRTGLSRRPPEELCEVILRHAAPHGELSKDAFARCMRDLVPSANLEERELVSYSHFLCNLFSCFDREERNAVNAKELASGFSFLCGGNKSSKLAIAFELLDENREGFLTARGLCRYFRSYLTVIVGISMSTTKLSRSDMFNAVDNGANWTQSHVFNSFNNNKKSTVTFEDFAGWYTEGGYTVAPWLELLDLTKFLSLLDSNSASAPTLDSDALADEKSQFDRNVSGNTGEGRGKRNRMEDDANRMDSGMSDMRTRNNDNFSHATSNHGGVNHGRQQQQKEQKPQKEVLFTFPLANNNSLVVLKEDVFYVRSVVDQLGLQSHRSEDVWSSLNKYTSRFPWNGGYVDQNVFVDAMSRLIGTCTGQNLDTLQNFFCSYDLDQVGRVKLTELMGGLTLLCKGRKSAKLAFSFGLFDARNMGPGHDPTKEGEHGSALNGDELFLFLRSFLIILFSCCAQSLELTADGVSLWINDTSRMVSDNVMRHQWKTCKRSVNFDDFGVWYNQGGFEIAPWLELLDLGKWVLDNTPGNGDLSSSQPEFSTAVSTNSDFQHMMDSPTTEDFPFDDFGGNFDQMMMHGEKENNRGPANASSTKGRTNCNEDSSLKFQLITNPDQGGYMVAISQERVSLLRQLVTESGFFRMDSCQVCRRILDHSNKDAGYLTKDQYDNAMRSIVAGGGTSMSPDSQRKLSELLTSIFYAFDRDKCARVDNVEFTAGFSILCGGRKSDKLEFAFDLIDDDRDGKLCRRGLWRYLRSFLTVLLNVSSAKAEMNEERILAAIDNGANWACSQVFSLDHVNRTGLVSFDEFADWYTKGGYGSIPWLELLDLKKWVIVA